MPLLRSINNVKIVAAYFASQHLPWRPHRTASNTRFRSLLLPSGTGGRGVDLSGRERNPRMVFLVNYSSRRARAHESPPNRLGSRKVEHLAPTMARPVPAGVFDSGPRGPHGLTDKLQFAPAYGPRPRASWKSYPRQSSISSCSSCNVSAYDAKADTGRCELHAAETSRSCRIPIGASSTVDSSFQTFRSMRIGLFQFRLHQPLAPSGFI